MKLSELKSKLIENDSLEFTLPHGENVPSHFHITEVGQLDKKFIDCGGTIRFESKVNLQMWLNDNDKAHRLTPSKLLSIIELSESKLGIQDLDIEVEYQDDTIGKYGLQFENGKYKLTSTLTDCLAPELCGVPSVEEKVSNSCAPGSGCC